MSLPATKSRFEFDEYGVNNRYSTERQEAEWLRMQNKQMDAYSERLMELNLEQKDLKQRFKDLDREFKDEGFNVSIAKRCLKDCIRASKKTEEEIETEEIVREWVYANPKVVDMIRKLIESDEEHKLAWESKSEERREKRMAFIQEHYKERRQREEEAGLGWIDFEKERVSKLASLGHEESKAKLVELNEEIRIRDERREQGLPPLERHMEPAYPQEYLEYKKKELAAQKEQEAKEGPKDPREERFKNYKPLQVYTHKLQDEDLEELYEFVLWKPNGPYGFMINQVEREINRRRRERWGLPMNPKDPFPEYDDRDDFCTVKDEEGKTGWDHAVAEIQRKRLEMDRPKDETYYFMQDQELADWMEDATPEDIEKYERFKAKTQPIIDAWKAREKQKELWKTTDLYDLFREDPSIIREVHEYEFMEFNDDIQQQIIDNLDNHWTINPPFMPVDAIMTEKDIQAWDEYQQMIRDRNEANGTPEENAKKAWEAKSSEIQEIQEIQEPTEGEVTEISEAQETTEGEEPKALETLDDPDAYLDSLIQPEPPKPVDNRTADEILDELINSL